ncbi:Hypothetical protein D9617_16g015730 [Elsinoe fawcettii]|nr:Hypothetical protein D9617_16g015730 [Elsinoe fawcettii]
MDAFTLYTFVLKAPANVRTVELYGSWDNFSRAWRLDRDLLRGRHSWSGCHKFENVIFDGIKPDWSKPRNGALKQGGRYWYFYRLDDDEEYNDPANPITNDCPLLPGQRLNVLDIPVEVAETLPRGRSASIGIVPFLHQPIMTLDPGDRFKKIKKQPLKLMRHFASSDGLESSASSAPSSSSLPNQSSNESFKSSATKASPVAQRANSFIKYRAQPSPSPLRRERQAPITPLSGSSRSSSRARSSPSPLIPFAPTQQSETLERPPTRPGSSSGSSRSGQSFYTVNSKPSFFTEKPLPSLPALPRLPSNFNPTAQDQGLGISLQQDTSEPPFAPLNPFKPSRNFARPFYAPQAPTFPLLPSTEEVNPFSTQAYPSPTSFSLASPTFTADTVSTPGFTTPHRLSASFHFDLSSEPLDLELSFNEHEAMSVDDVERRLSRLQTGDEDTFQAYGGLTPDTRVGRAYDRTPSPFLRHPEAAKSDVTIGKVATPRPGVFIVDGEMEGERLGMGEGMDGGSEMGNSPGLAGRIFGELGFLGRVIN